MRKEFRRTPVSFLAAKWVAIDVRIGSIVSAASVCLAILLRLPISVESL